MMERDLTPAQIVGELDKYIIGQEDAKRALALALRNRWRRKKVKGQLKDEITPKNIILIGPTGVGKTEIAKRLAKLSGAPFLKVEATKFTEVGYVGRNVDSIIKDLADIAYQNVLYEERQKLKARSKMDVREILLQKLKEGGFITREDPETDGCLDASVDLTKFEDRFDKGEFEQKMIEIEMEAAVDWKGGSEELSEMFGKLFQKEVKTRRCRLHEARRILEERRIESLLDMDGIKTKAREQTEEMGIVFIDEIDKITFKGFSEGPGISREGVQRDLLPIVEGCSVSTRLGFVRSEHILFIAAGAFHASRPSDLIPEFQGRFPIRVELNALNRDDFEKILVEPENSLSKQYIALLETEGVSLSFDEGGIGCIAEFAETTNRNLENIGARRLHTIMERVFEELSFDLPNPEIQSILIDESYVRSRLEHVVKDQDLSRFIL